MSAQTKHITTLESSKCAFRQDNHCAIVKSSKWDYFRVKFTLFSKQQHPSGISSQNLLLKNSSPVRSIFTCSILIDSAGPAKNYWNSKNVPKFIIGEQLGIFIRATIIHNLLTVQPILINKKPIDSAQQAQGHGSMKQANSFILVEQAGSFRKSYPQK